MAFDPSTAQLDSTFDPDTATESPDPGFKAGDYLKGLKRGVLAVPGALTGLADIPIALATGERVAGPVADALGRVTGFQPSKWAKETGETFSPGAKAAQAKIEEAWKGSGADRLGNALLGNFDDLPAAWKDADLAGAGRAIVENPGASALQVVESLPAMLAGGAIGKGVAVASKLAPAIAGAIGEGAITAGQQMDQTDAAVDPRRAAATSATAGALTGAIAGGMGRVAQKLGLEDIQTTMAGGKADATGLGRAGRLAGGAASEALQEIPQSAQEQVWQNVAEEKPLGEGVVRSAVEGGIAGGVMGAGANLRRPGTPLPPPGATAPGDIAEMDTLNAGLAQAGNDYAGQLPPNAGLLEEKPLVVQNPTTGVVTEIDRRGGPLEQAAAIAVESGAHEVAQNVDASEILFPYANARAAQDYIGRQADPEMYDAVPHPRVEGRTAVVPKTGPARQAILDKRASDAANEHAKLRGEQLKQDESPAPTEITESIAGTFGNGSTGNVTITPQRGGGFEIRVSSSDGATKRSSVAGFPAGTNRARAIAAATRSHGGFTKDKPVVKAKPVVDTTVADAAQDELAPPTVQPVTDMPGVQQRAKVQAQGAVATAQTRAAQLADEENIDSQAQAANPEPSEAQRTAGNYAHGHIRVGGLDISVETPAGAVRTGTDKGKTWKVKNTAHYGYVKRTQGADGEQVDVYVKPGTSSTSGGPVFVVDQYNPATGAFDEHKALLGYNNQAEAAAAYDAHFSDKSGPKRRGAVTQMSLDAFKGWLANGDTSKAVSGKRFGKVVADNEQAAQDEIARSTGKLSLPRSAQKPGESDAAFELRRAAATQAAKTARVAGQQALPTKDSDKAGVREALGMPDDAEVSILSAESRPDAGQAKGVSKQAAQFIQQVARTFGKRVVFFDVPDRGAAEGFYVRGNTIYLNTNSSTQHLRVLGHEMTHAMKRQARDSYEKMLGAVAALRTDEEMAAQFNDYFGRPLDDVALLDQPHPGSDGTLREFLAEEWMADLGGNRFAEAEFWTSVFGRLEGQHGTEAAKGIIAKLRLALVAALNKLKSLIGGNAFAVDARLGEHLEGIRTAVAEGFAEYARLSKAGQLAEVSGEAKFKPGSDIGHKRESDGRYVGAPEWVGDSPQQLAVLRKKLLQLTLEGEPGRFWYEQSSKAILDLAKGDKDEAEKIVQLIAIYSPSAQVPGNTTLALKAYYQWKQGLPVRVGFGQADRKANALLYEGKEWKGMKTNTFYSNLMEEIDPSKNLDGATMDMWMAIAFDYGSKALDQGPKYKFAERETQRIAKRLGWSPHQVQAAIWTAMKGRVDPIRGVLTAQELDNGWYDEESQAWWASGEKAKYESRRDAALRDRAAGKRTPFARVDVGTEKLQPARRKDHYHLAHKLGMEYNLTPEDVAASKYDFSNAINERMAQMSWEATPGETTGVLPGIHKAPMHQQQEYLVAIRKALSDEKGNDLIGKEVGLALAASVQGFSGWQGVSTVGIQDGIAIPFDTATSAVQQMAIDAINLVADIKGLVLYQEGVAWHFPHYKGSKNGQNGVEFRIGRLLTEEENANLYKGLVTALGHTYAPPIPTQDGQGFRVLNFPDEKFALMDDFGKSPEEQKRKKDLQKAQLEKNVAFIEAVRKTVFKQPWHAEVTDEARFESIGELRENDWSKGDGDYRGRIAEANGRWPQTQNRWAGRSDIQGWIEHDLRPRVAEVNRDFSERYGWGKASLSPQRGVAGPDAAGNRQLGGDGQAGLRRQVQPESVSAVGVHYSKQPRERLDSSYFGTGIPGAEVERVADATDPRIKQRIYFYVNNGRPIKPEEGVGSHAHQAQLDNLYDYANDPLDLRVTNTFSGFESALLDKGFDGAINLERGIAVLLGQRNLAVEYIGQNDRPDVPQAAQAEPSTFGKQMRAVAANRGLPSGEMTGADWKRLMPKLMPDIDVSHLNDEQKYYKDEVVKRPQAAKLSTSRTTDPYANPDIETRPGTTEEQRTIGRDALAALEQRLGRFRDSGGQGASLVGTRLYKSFVATGGAQLVGQRVASNADLAVLAQVYRDPRFETFRAIYTKQGKVVGETAYSSRLPGVVRLGPGITFDIRSDFERLGADGVYMVHNHPSGWSRPSPADIYLTQDIAKAVPMLGHVVIDHNEYSTIDADGTHEVVSAPELAGVKFTGDPAAPHPFLDRKIDGPPAVAAMAKELQAQNALDAPVLILTKGPWSEVDLIAKLPTALLGDLGIASGRAKAWLRSVGRTTGAGGYRFILVSDDTYQQYAKPLKKLLGDKLITDVVSASGASLMYNGVRAEFGAQDVFEALRDAKPVKMSTQRYSIERDEEDEGTFAVARDPSQKDVDGGPLEVGRLHVPDEAVSSKGWRIGDIEVSPGSRRQGIASELIRRMTEELGVPVTGATSVFSPDGKALFEAVRAAKMSTQRLAPNGKPSNLDERQWRQVRTPEFKTWFGDWEAAHNGKDGNGVWARDDVSKVVDENGEPLVVYHGTERGGFTTFRPDMADRQLSPMIFAAATRKTARTYAGQGTEIDLDPIEEPLAGYHVVKTEVENYPWKVVDQYGSDVDAYQRFQSEAMAQKWLDMEREDAESENQVGVYSLFLNLRNPNEADFEGANWDGTAPYGMYEVVDDNDESFYSSQGDRFMDIVTARIVAERHGLPDDAIRPAQDLPETTNSVAEDALRYGNDGAIIRRATDDGGNSGAPADVDDVFVVFDANQLKSAVGNTGTFSTKNDDIRYSPPRFVSQLARTFESAPAKLQTQPAAQWKLWLAGQQAVKKDEIAWSGINDWLDLQGKAKVSRAQIQEYLAAKVTNEGLPLFSLRRALNGEHNTDDHLVPETPLYLDNPDLVDLAYANGKPIRLNVGLDLGPGKGRGALHLIASAERDRGRGLDQVTDDEGENVVRTVLRTIGSGSAQLHWQDGQRYALRIPLANKTLILQNNRDYFSIVTMLPSAENKWGTAEWAGRLTFPAPAIATTADPSDPAPAKSSQAGLKGIGYSSEKFKVTPDAPLVQSPRAAAPRIVVKVAQKKHRTLDAAAMAADGLAAKKSPVRANLGAMTPAQAVAANNVLGSPKTFMQRLAEFRKDWAKNLKQGIFDQFAPIAELDQQAYIQARLSKGGESTLEALMLYGKLFVGADGATDVRYTRAGGKQGFAGKMSALKGEHDRFLLWVAAQRADRLQAIGLENLWSEDDIKVLSKLNEGSMKDGTDREPLFKQALRDLNEFNDNVLDVAVSSGLIDDATRQMYAGTPYVPFYRLQEDDSVSGFGVKPGLVNQYAWKRLKGGTQKLNEDLLANLLHNWSHLITASAKNRAAKATLDAAATAGIAAQVPAGMPGKGHVSYKAAGQEQVFVVSDPHLFDAVAALHYAGLGPWAKPLSAAKHWLTIGVTANPAFKLRNLIRDSIGALGSAQLSYNVAGNIQQGWQATAEDNETRAHLLASGGMIRFGSMLDGQDSQRAADLIHEGVDPAMILDSDAKIKKFWKRYVHPALSAYNEFGDRTENLNRAALYEQLIAKGLTNAEAAYWSRDLMDFAMAGKWTAIRTLTQTVPFFNARLQGLYKLGRAGKQDIRRLGTVLGAVSLSSLALLLAYGDDDDWKKRSDSDRNNYWWFKVGGHAFRVPKPFEIGAVGTLAERGYELMFEKEMTDARFGRNMRDIVMSQLGMNPVPQLFKPMMDIYANKDSFTGRDIESMGMERLRKQDRYDEKTSEVARFLGSLGLPDPTQMVMGRWDTLSPKQVDFLARGYFSWLGTMTTTALDYGIRPMLDRGVRPELQLKDVFFAGNFVESLPSNQSRYLTQLYDQAREIEQAYASYHNKLKVGDTEGARELREEEGALIKRYPATQQLKRAESLLNQQLQRINASTTLSGEEKRVRLDQVYARRNTLAERFQAQ